MNWAKVHSKAKYSLTASGMPNVLMKDLPFEKEDLELTYGDYGWEPLIETIAERSGVRSENVVLSFGTSMANHLAMAALIEPGDEVLIETPVYEPLVSAARYLGAKLNFTERSYQADFQLDIDEVTDKITDGTTLVVLTNLHNPSSSHIPSEALKQIGAAAARVGARVLVDEVYIETMFDDAPETSFHLGENFVATNSLTKTYGLSGLRSGWILAEAPLASSMHRLNDLFGATNVHVAERLSLAAFKNLDVYRRRAKALLETNRPLLNGFLDSRPDLESFKPLYGTTAFPRLRAGDPEKLFEVLRGKYETSVVPGRFFYADRHFRIGISCDTENLRGGLERLSDALDEVAQ